MNTLPFLVLALLFYVISNRAWLAFLADGIVCLAFSFANCWKLQSRSDPVTASDFAVIKAAAKMSSKYIHLSKSMICCIICLAAVTAILFFAARGKIGKVKLRAVLCLVILAASFILYKGVYLNEELSNSFKSWEGIDDRNENVRFFSRGSIYPFICSIRHAVQDVPKGYSEDEAKKILSMYEDSDIADEDKISLVYVMLEAFSDFSDYTDHLDGKDAYGYFHELKEQSVSGRLITNIFAGGTIDTERTVLTGFNKTFKFNVPGESYARYFIRQGYSVIGSHAGYENFYSRKLINENLGFENYHFIENYYSGLCEDIPWDNIFIPDITRSVLDELDRGEAVFAFDVSYQNHGPYDDSTIYFDEDYISLKSAGSQSAYVMLNNYLHGIEDTMQNIKNMVDAFNERKEPVVLVLFGDHKPWMGDQSWVYEALGIDITGKTDDWFINKYSTEYLIIANDAAKEKLGSEMTGKGPEISPCYLMNAVFDLCGYEGSAYTKYSDELMAVLPVVSTNKRYMEEGRLVTEEELSEKAKALLKEAAFVQYYLSYNAQ